MIGSMITTTSTQSLTARSAAGVTRGGFNLAPLYARFGVKNSVPVGHASNGIDWHQGMPGHTQTRFEIMEPSCFAAKFAGTDHSPSRGCAP